MVLARTSLFVGALSFVCPLLGLLALPAGVLVRKMARRDLDLICLGDMNHEGYKPTEKARSDCHAGIVLSLLSFLLWGVLSCGFVLNRVLPSFVFSG